MVGDHVGGPHAAHSVFPPTIGVRSCDWRFLVDVTESISEVCSYELVHKLTRINEEARRLARTRRSGEARPFEVEGHASFRSGLLNRVRSWSIAPAHRSLVWQDGELRLLTENIAITLRDVRRWTRAGGVDGVQALLGRVQALVVRRYGTSWNLGAIRG